MNCIIDYKLLTGNIVEIEKKDYPAKYLPEKSIEFDDNLIDVEDMTYIRTTSEYMFKIDFKTNICELKYDENHIFKFDIKGNMKINNTQIKIEYSSSSGLWIYHYFKKK